MIDIQIKKFSDNAKLPSYVHIESDAGMDIYSAENVLVKAGERAVIKSGIGIQAKFRDNLMPLFENCFKIALIIRGTSGNCVKKYIETVGGTVDQGYTGEIIIVLWNKGKEDVQINIGNKIAQCIFTLVPRVYSYEVVDDFKETDRNDKGFGSSGVVGGV
jgi:dUTP pyrophosphatase